jgi:hypothetical protein
MFEIPDGLCCASRCPELIERADETVSEGHLSTPRERAENARPIVLQKTLLFSISLFSFWSRWMYSLFRNRVQPTIEPDDGAGQSRTTAELS